MTDDMTMASVSRLEAIQVGRRRRWTLEEKRRIVGESYEGRRRASAMAWRHGLSPSQLFTWRRLAREGRIGTDEETLAFAPAIIACEPGRSLPLPDDGHATDVPSCRSSADPAGRMEIVLDRGRRVIVDRPVDVAVLAWVITVLERP